MRPPVGDASDVFRRRNALGHRTGTIRMLTNEASKQNWNTNNPESDLDNDGSVSGGDLAILLGQWGSCN